MAAYNTELHRSQLKDNIATITTAILCFLGWAFQWGMYLYRWTKLEDNWQWNIHHGVYFSSQTR